MERVMAGTNDGATCMVGLEGSYGSVLSTDARALDDATIAGLTVRSLGITIDSFNAALGALRMVAYERNDVTANGGMSQARVEAAVNGSGPVKRVVGTVPIQGEFRGFGGLSPSATGWGYLMESGFGSTIRTPGTSCTATEALDNTFTVGGGDIGKFANGDIIAVTQTDGTFRACKVTDVNVGTTTVTTLEPHGIPNASTATVRQCHMWWPLRGTTSGGTVVMQLCLADEDQVYLGVGGVLKSMELVPTGTVSLDWRAEVEFNDGEYRSAVVIPTTEPFPMGAVSSATTPLVRLVAPNRVTQDHASSSAPFSGTAAALASRTWSFKATNDLQADGGQETRSGRSNTRVMATRGEGSFTQTAPTGSVPDWREVLRAGQKRSASFTAAGANAAGNGAGVWVGAVETGADPGVTIAPTDQTQDVSFRSGNYTGDTTSSPGEANNKEFVIFAVC